MNRAQISVAAGEKIAIDGKIYQVAKHPALPGMPYVQRGARGVVIQLITPDGERLALKYFKLKYRVPELVKVAEALKQYADLPGLRAARRTVFTKAANADLLTHYPALEYGMMMPWLPGTTWYDVITTKAILLPQDSVKIAQETSRILANLEDKGVAHCDIAGANVMLERRAGQVTGHVELVDIEEMYGPNLPQPVEAPAGQDGYQHRYSRQHGQWSAVGDRFSAAVLLVEMLSWANPRIRQNSTDEHYFAASEMQDAESARYRLLLEVLRDDYSQPIAESFEVAWRSNTLSTCPLLAQWRDLLAAVKVDETKPQPVLISSPVISGRRAIPGVPLPNDGTSPLPDPGPDRVQLDGTRLCRNCGEQNSTTESFCKRCGFYIGIGARPKVAVHIPIPGSVKAQQAAKTAAPSVPAPTTTAPQVVTLNRDMDSIIVARRVGDPVQGMQRVISPEKEQDQPIEANFGSWIIVALVVGTILAIALLVLLNHK